MNEAMFHAGLRTFVAAATLWLFLQRPSLVAAEPDALQAATALQDLLVDAIAKAEHSVVAIARVRREADAPEGAVPTFPFTLPGQGLAPTDPELIPHEFGAGVVVDAGGLILTTQDVIGDPEISSYYVWSQKRPFRAQVLAAAPWFDLAVLQVAAENAAFEPVKFGDGAGVRKGQIVIALGNPYAIARDGSVSASWGIVSNLARSAPRVPTRSAESLGRETVHHFGTLIQTDAKLTLGYSGGALVNLQGEMVGLTTSFAAATNYEAAAGFAIPVDEPFRRVVETLKRGETPEFGFLGVSPEPLPESLRQRGLHGTRVVSVVEGAPADLAGLRPDDVITHINGRSISDEKDLFRQLGSLAPGSTASLTVARGIDVDPDLPRLELEVPLSKKYVRTARRAVGNLPTPAWRGMRVDYATASPQFEAGVQRPPSDSLFVAEVSLGSPAWKAGIRVGDFITHVDDSQVTTPQAFAAAVARAAGDVTVHVTRDGRQTTPRTVSP